MRRPRAGAAVTLAALAAPASSFALSAQEAILRAKPAVALITARVDAEVTINCGQGPVTVKPRPFIETGTGWLVRSEEHTSELQSPCNLVCRLLLEKKKTL